MMNRFLVVARSSTIPRAKVSDSFEDLRRANYERDDRERENWHFNGAPRQTATATYDRTRYVEPAE